MVYYRKYRPQTISELDLESVREKLLSILKSGNIPHAFLFTGPKGLGKTSAARIVAKAINCERLVSQRLASSSKKESKKEKLNARRYEPNTDIEPCNECDACTSITNGSNIDVLEIDAASNRGIDEIRELRDRIKYAPASLPHKVYIIDEVHMLTTEAFNALLKTLEEPPEHATFILCTTEDWKLPPTIVSRAFHIQFEKPNREELTRSLDRIVKGEKLEVEREVLEKLFELSDGAFRDAAKILEELALASSGQKITVELLEKSFKTGAIEQEVEELIRSLSQKNTKEALLVIDRLARIGCDFRVVTEKIVDKLRSLLLDKSGVLEGVDLTHLEGIKLGVESAETLLEYFNQAYKDIRFSVLPQLPLELAIVKYCVIDQTPRIKHQEPNNIQISNKEEKEDYSSSDPALAGESRSSRPASRQGGQTQTVTTHDDFLKSLIERVKKDNFSVAGVLRSVKLVKVGDDGIEFVTPYKFHGEKLQDTKVGALLDKTASEILGKNVKIVVTIKEKS